MPSLEDRAWAVHTGESLSDKRTRTRTPSHMANSETRLRGGSETQRARGLCLHVYGISEVCAQARAVPWGLGRGRRWQEGTG